MEHVEWTTNNTSLRNYQILASVLHLLDSRSHSIISNLICWFKIFNNLASQLCIDRLVQSAVKYKMLILNVYVYVITFFSTPACICVHIRRSYAYLGRP